MVSEYHAGYRAEDLRALRAFIERALEQGVEAGISEAHPMRALSRLMEEMTHMRRRQATIAETLTEAARRLG